MFKFKKKNIIAVFLAIALIITGAFALLTATDVKVNNFTVGNVKIEVVEPNWVPDTDINGDGELDGIGNIVPL